MALVRGLIGYAPAVIVPRLITLMQVTLLTRMIPQVEFGLFVLVITIGDALDMLCCNWIRVVLGRYGAGKDASGLAEEAARAFLAYALTLLCVGIPGAAMWSFTQQASAPEFFLSLAFYLVTNGLARHCLVILSIRGLKLPFFIVEAVRTGLGFAGVMTLAWTGLAKTYAPLLMMMNGATALAAAIGMVLALRGIGFRKPSDWGFDRLGYGLPLMAGTFVGVALNSSDRIVTEAFAGPAALATYAAAVMLARQPLEFLFSVVNVRTFPELMAVYEKAGPTAAGERIGDLISIMAMLSCPAAIGLALVAGPLAQTFLTPAYVEPAQLIIPIGAAAGLLFGFKMFVFDQTLHMTKRIWGNILMTLPVTILGVALSAFLASRVGAVGCVEALLVQSAMAVAISAVQASRLMKITLHTADLARIALMCAAMVVSVSAVLSALSSAPAPVRLLCAIVVGGGIYVASGLILRPGPVRDLIPRGRVEAA